jgi:hypothetical protein
MYFEFVVHITEDHLGRKRLPDKFAEFLSGWEPAAVNLREVSCHQCRWPTEVLFDGQGKMYLSIGFARAHNLEVGCMCSAATKAMETCASVCSTNSSCRSHYHNDDSGEDSDGQL